MMRFHTTLTLLTQICLELIAILAKVMEHPSPLRGFCSQCICGFSKPVGQCADTTQVIFQQVWLSCSILRVRQEVHG